MNDLAPGFQRRVESIKLRINSLGSLRKTVALQPAYDITERQWSVLNSQLSVVENRLQSKLKNGARRYFPQMHDPRAARNFNALLGEIELEMATAFVLFDTYSDVLTQRHSPELGPQLAGCDVLARSVLSLDSPALSIIEPALVYCARGFGASTLREGVLMPDRTPNPMPLIQIPYSRLKEKHNLTSILHEAGHEAMVRLGLNRTIPKAFRLALTNAGAPDAIKDLFALWTTEIVPDFWTFCSSGLAQPATIREILALPSNRVFRISWIDPHPSPYIRVLLSIEWCRQVWGKGIWDNWEEEWLEFYPLENAAKEEGRIVKEAAKYVPLIGNTLLTTKFRALNRKPIKSLFNLSKLAPAEMQIGVEAVESGSLNPNGLSPAAHLAIFRLIREKGKLSEETLDKMMRKWLINLGEKRNG